MYSIIQKIYEKNNNILKEGLKKVLNGSDVSSLTGAIKDFTDILGKELFTEIVTQIENLVFDDAKRKNQYESIRFAEKSLVTKNGKTKFERRYYKDNETDKHSSNWNSDKNSIIWWNLFTSQFICCQLISFFA